MVLNVKENMLSFGANVQIITNSGNRITKERFIDEASGQQLLRLDTGENELLEPLNIKNVNIHGYDCVAISDYDKGFLTTQKIFDLVDWFDGPVFIDSKKTTLPVHKDNVFIKINEDEYKKLTHQESKNLIVTKGANGADYQGTNYPAIGCGVFDVCGAGDTFLASLVYFFSFTSSS